MGGWQGGKVGDCASGVEGGVCPQQSESVDRLLGMGGGGMGTPLGLQEFARSHLLELHPSTKPRAKARMLAAHVSQSLTNMPSTAAALP